MLNQACAGLILVTLFAAQGAAAELTPVEAKWLSAAEPVLDYAREQGLAIDVIVRPDSKAGDVPLSVGVRDKRCKLVLAMRNNPDAEQTLAGIPETQHALMIEAMVAHEAAHCWRFAKGIWHAVPAGFVDPVIDDQDAESSRRQREMRATRREEAFADLVGLAWTSQAHPADYAVVHSWLAQLRSDQPMAGSYHDTRMWVELAAIRSVFSSADVASPFEQALALWTEGLRHE